jgi:hypothetical protein
VREFDVFVITIVELDDPDDPRFKGAGAGGGQVRYIKTAPVPDIPSNSVD